MTNNVLHHPLMRGTGCAALILASLVLARDLKLADMAQSLQQPIGTLAEPAQDIEAAAPAQAMAEPAPADPALRGSEPVVVAARASQPAPRPVAAPPAARDALTPELPVELETPALTPVAQAEHQSQPAAEPDQAAQDQTPWEEPKDTPPLAAQTDTAPDPEDDPAYAGDQEGRAVPDLAITALTRHRVTALLASRKMALWVETDTGHRYWFVPAPNNPPSPNLLVYFSAGNFVEDAATAGLQTEAQGAGQLREIPLAEGNRILPLRDLESLAQRRIMPQGRDPLRRAQIRSAGLRLSPMMEAEIIASQERAMARMGEQTANDMKMQGCWDNQGAFTIASATDAAGTLVYQGPSPCAG